MAHRRQFLQMSAAAVALRSTQGLASPMPRWTSRPATAGPLPYKVVFDAGIPECVAYASAARQLGASPVAIHGDVTDLWYGDLYHRWRREPATVAGLTTDASLFCLERLAWDQNLRVVFRAEHRDLGDGRVEHHFSGAQCLLPRSSAQATRRSDWIDWMAQLTLRAGARPSRTVRSAAVTRVTGPLSTTQPLVSWIIAPRYAT